MTANPESAIGLRFHVIASGVEEVELLRVGHPTLGDLAAKRTYDVIQPAGAGEIAGY